MIAIAARSKNNVIGLNNKIPWHSKEDFKHFRKITENKTILVGHKTWQSLPTLKNRQILVLTNQVESKQIAFTSFQDNSVAWFVDLWSFEKELKENPNIVVCGGARIYELFLPRCSDLYLTEFDFEIQGDTFFPEFSHIFTNKEVLENIPNGIIYRYWK